MQNMNWLTVEEIEAVAETFKDDLTREGKRCVRRKNLDKALAAFASEEYIDQFVYALKMRARSQIGRPKEPRKRIRDIYIPDAVRSARVPLTKEQKESQKHAREVAEASRCKGHPKHF